MPARIDNERRAAELAALAGIYCGDKGGSRLQGTCVWLTNRSSDPRRRRFTFPIPTWPITLAKALGRAGRIVQ